MIDDTSIVMGALWTAEEFSVLTISPAFIIQVIFAIVTLFVVFYLDVESWKEFLMFLVMTIVASLFVSLYAMAWYVRIKYDTSPDFTASFGIDSFPGWGAFLGQMIHGSNVTQNALLHAIILFWMPKTMPGICGGLKYPRSFS